jgi:hypothetical protein
MKSANWISDGDEAVERGAYGDADYARLGQRCVEDSRLAKARVQAVGGAEHAALLAHVLAHHDHAIVALHLLGDG